MITPSPRAIEALRMKQSVAYVSIKKIPTMLACVNTDGRIRGLLGHHTATTGRSGSSLVQFQNIKRSTINTKEVAWSELAYQDVKKGISREMMELCYGAPLEVISSMVRHFVDCGSPQLDADYSAIEGRIVCWLSGQEDALQEYRDGVDRYAVMAAFIYGKPVSQINKFPERFVGKQAILLCCYLGGAQKLVDTCWKMGRYKLPLPEAEQAVSGFRRKHDKLKKYWYAVEDAAQKAIINKGKIFPVRNISFLCKNIGDMPFLLLKLPSGRKLAYPRPRLVPSPKFRGRMMIEFFGNIKGTTWGFINTFSGRLVENVTQAVAGDILMHGVANCERHGYQVHSLIHDQCLAYYEPEKGQSVEEFVRLLTDLPDWATGLPLAAEGDLVPFYRKES